MGPTSVGSAEISDTSIPARPARDNARSWSPNRLRSAVRQNAIEGRGRPVKPRPRVVIPAPSPGTQRPAPRRVPRSVGERFVGGKVLPVVQDRICRDPRARADVRDVYSAPLRTGGCHRRIAAVAGPVTVALVVLLFGVAVGGAVSAVSTFILRRPVGAWRRRERIIDYRLWAVASICFAVALGMNGIAVLTDRPLLGVIGSGFLLAAALTMVVATGGN